MTGSKIKLGWFIPDQVLGCVQYQDTLTIAAMSDLANQAAVLLQSTDHPFYFLLDNRFLSSPSVASAKSILHMFPFTKHPDLELVLIIKPEVRKRGLNGKLIDTKTEHQFLYVDSLTDAYSFLQGKLQPEEWLLADQGFFPLSPTKVRDQPW